MGRRTKNSDDVDVVGDPYRPSPRVLDPTQNERMMMGPSNLEAMRTPLKQAPLSRPLHAAATLRNKRRVRSTMQSKLWKFKEAQDQELTSFGARINGMSKLVQDCNSGCRTLEAELAQLKTQVTAWQQTNLQELQVLSGEWDGKFESFLSAFEQHMAERHKEFDDKQQRFKGELDALLEEQRGLQFHAQEDLVRMGDELRAFTVSLQSQVQSDLESQFAQIGTHIAQREQAFVAVQKQFQMVDEDRRIQYQKNQNQLLDKIQELESRVIAIDAAHGNGIMAPTISSVLSHASVSGNSQDDAALCVSCPETSCTQLQFHSTSAYPTKSVFSASESQGPQPSDLGQYTAARSGLHSGTLLLSQQLQQPRLGSAQTPALASQSRSMALPGSQSEYRLSGFSALPQYKPARQASMAQLLPQGSRHGSSPGSPSSQLKQ
eukprot:gene2233-3115_t